MNAHGAAPRRPRIRRGFTLTEITITIGVLALVVGVTVMAVGGRSSADLRSATARITSMTRAAYDQAALTGQIHRLGFEFAKLDAQGNATTRPQVTVEATPEQLRFDGEESLLARAQPKGGSLGGWTALSAGFALGAEDDESTNLDSFLPGGVDELLGLAGSADRDFDDDDGFQSEVDSTFQEVFPPFVLPESVSILDVWTDAAEETVREGKAYVYFFPHGYAQDALIHLGFSDSDRDDVGFTVKVEALTGRATASDEYLEIPR
ncbi:MAG: prepilin-type N-terminal cleavage/methylation domain-containing protein [Myxococcota bacterium]